MAPWREALNVEARRAALADILRGDHVASQESLAQRLSDAGFEVTQATVSRDLEALGATRSKRDGKAIYLLPGGASDSALDRILAEWRIAIESAGNLVIMRTRPGSAHVVGAALDAAGVEGIAGTIAGDDTLFIAVRDGFAAAEVARKLG
jgi:transcriptional regulator of arginine metabolism